MSMAAPRAVVRHPHRRRRPDLPPPRGRDRPERGGDRRAVRADLAALRAPPDGRREDGQVDREHRPGRRAARRRGLAAGAALRADRRPLPRAAQLLRDESLAAAAAAIERLDAAVAALAAYREDRPPTTRRCRGVLATARDGFEAALDDDLNVSAALAALFDLRPRAQPPDRRGGRCRPPTRRGRGGAPRPRPRSWASLPDEPTSSTPSCAALLDAARPRRARAATGPRRTGCATSSRARGVAVEDTRDGQRWRLLVTSGG